MKTKIKSIIALLVLVAFFLTSCGSSQSSTSSRSHRSVNHYHHGHHGYYGHPYYGSDVIIIDDGVDIDTPVAVPLAEEY